MVENHDLRRSVDPLESKTYGVNLKVSRTSILVKKSN